MASSVDARRIIARAPYRAYAVIKSSTTFESITGGLTGMDAETSLDGAAFADAAAAEVEIGTTGYAYVDLSVAEMSGDMIWLRFDASNANAIIYEERLYPEACSDSGVAQSATASTVVIRSGAVASNDFYNGQQIEIVRGTGAGQTRTITDYVGASKTVSVDRDWITNPDTTSVYVIKFIGTSQTTAIDAKADVLKINGEADAASNMAALYLGGLIASSVNDAGATTTVFIGDTGLSTTNDFYQYAWLIFTSGANEGVCERISDYVGGTLTITLQNALPAAPANNDTFVILGKAR